MAIGNLSQEIEPWKNQPAFGKMTKLDFEPITAAAGFSLMAAPYVSRGAAPDQPLTRVLGRTGFEVTTLGLGGQAALQWTPPGENPEHIILKLRQMECPFSPGKIR